MPEDSADSKLLLSVHYYTPWDYCGTDGVNQWGSPGDYDEMNGLFEKLSKFSEQGYGVVIGEYAVMMKNGGIKPDTDLFYSNLMDNCDLYDFCPVLWDCSSFYKRSTNTLSDETLAELFSSRAYANEAGRGIRSLGRRGDRVDNVPERGLHRVLQRGRQVRPQQQDQGYQGDQRPHHRRGNLHSQSGFHGLRRRKGRGVRGAGYLQRRGPVPGLHREHRQYPHQRLPLSA